MNNVITESILDSFEHKIRQHHQLYPKIPIKAEYWESIVANGLNTEGWIPNNHNINEDLKTNISGLMRPSLKSGIISEDILTYSSHRMSRYSELTEMTYFLDNTTYDSHLFLARKNTKDHFNYCICYMPAGLIKFSELEWTPILATKGNKKGKQTGWSAISQDGKIKCKIQFSMSNQLWIEIHKNLFMIMREIHV